MDAPVSKRKPATRGPTTIYTLVLVILVFTIVLLPFALGSAADDVTEEATPVYQLLPRRTGSQIHSNLNLQVIGISEWEGVATIRVSVHQTCNRACPWGDRYLFVSAYGDTSGESRGLPSSEVVFLPATTRDVVQVIRMPLFGDPIRYPFDRYRLALGIIVDRVFADGSVQTLPADQAREYLHLTLQGRVPRADMSRPESLDPATVQNDEDIEPYAVIELLTFSRPLYLKVLTVLLVLLVTAAACYAVFMRPLDQLIINSGALVLGVWGVRSILLGTGVPGLTAVDLALNMVILFLLIAITVRTLYLLEEKSTLRLVRRLLRVKEKETKEEAPTAPKSLDFVPDSEGAEPESAAASAPVAPARGA